MPIGMPAIMRIVEAPSGLAYETVFDPAMRYGLVKPYRLDSKNGAQFVNPLNKELMEFIVLEGNCSPSVGMRGGAGGGRLSLSGITRGAWGGTAFWAGGEEHSLLHAGRGAR